MLPNVAMAGGGGEAHSHMMQVMLGLACLLLMARVGALVERLNQPAVLGELCMGMLLGTLAFVPGALGDFVAMLKTDHTVLFVIEFGVILLLFKSGLEEDLHHMLQVGIPALKVATVGVLLPLIGGGLASWALMPDQPFMVHLFIGATLAATSVGITVAVFDAFEFKSKETKIVLGAAVFDDIMALVILGVASAMAQGGDVTLLDVLWMFLRALLFLGFSIGLGMITAPWISAFLSRIHAGAGMKMAMALLFCVVYSVLAVKLAGLAAIVGAFAAGLVLDAVHFKRFKRPVIVEKIASWVERLDDDQADLRADMLKALKKSDEKHVEDLIEGLSKFFVPLFFVVTGMQVDMRVFGDVQVLLISAALVVVAFFGKYLAGFVAGEGLNKKLIGYGMVPRGEVGLIAANIGAQTGVLDAKSFAIAVVVVIVSTLMAPPFISAQIRKMKAAAVTVTQARAAE